MSKVEQFINSQPKVHQELYWRLRDLIFKAAPNIEEKPTYGIAFYYYFGRVFYLGPLKTGGVDFGFCRGFELSNEQDLLATRNRNTVKSIEITSVDDIDEAAIMQVIQEALMVNEMHHQNKKKK
jgi:hypothetical protein